LTEDGQIVGVLRFTVTDDATQAAVAPKNQ
jgi:hypothetical protein